MAALDQLRTGASESARSGVAEAAYDEQVRNPMHPGRHAAVLSRRRALHVHQPVARHLQRPGLRSRRPQVRILSGAPTLQALFPQEKGLFLGVLPFFVLGRLHRVRVRSGQTWPQNTPFEHQKLAEKLAPRPRRPAGPAAASRASPNRARTGSEAMSHHETSDSPRWWHRLRPSAKRCWRWRRSPPPTYRAVHPSGASTSSPRATCTCTQAVRSGRSASAYGINSARIRVRLRFRAPGA